MEEGPGSISGEGVGGGGLSKIKKNAKVPICVVAQAQYWSNAGYGFEKHLLI